MWKSQTWKFRPGTDKLDEPTTAFQFYYSSSNFIFLLKVETRITQELIDYGLCVYKARGRSNSKQKSRRQFRRGNSP